MNNDLPKSKEEVEAERERMELAPVVAEINKKEELRKEEEKQKALQIENIKTTPSKVPDPNAEKEKKNLIKLGIIALILISALIGYRIYLNKKNEPEKQLTVDEQIIKTLNNRYGTTFTKIDNTTYKDASNNNVKIITNADSSNKLIIYDDYLNKVQVDKIKSRIENNLRNNGLSNVTIELEPKKDCRFIGNCVKDYFFASYKENTDETILSKRSSEIILKDYLNMDMVQFFNEIEFMIYIKINGNYSEYDIDTIKMAIKNLFNELNDSGYKNKLGYEIVVKDKNGINEILTLKSGSTTDSRFDIYTAKEN